MSNFWDKIKPSTPPPAVVDMQVSKDGSKIQLVWQDGVQTSLSARTLRQNCPCAACVDEWTHQRTLDARAVPEGITLKQVGQVGNYALSLHFSDQHTTGIFNWPHLRSLIVPS